MYLNIGQGNILGLGNIGGFAYTNYWSSTESVYSPYAWDQSFGSGNQATSIKNVFIFFRAVRAF